MSNPLVINASTMSNISGLTGWDGSMTIDVTDTGYTVKIVVDSVEYTGTGATCEIAADATYQSVP